MPKIDDTLMDELVRHVGDATEARAVIIAVVDQGGNVTVNAAGAELGDEEALATTMLETGQRLLKAIKESGTGGTPN